jgi:hypothetical protein
MYILLYSLCCLAHETFEILTAVIITVTSEKRTANKEQTNNHRTQLYKVSIQLHVSTLWGHNQACI